jgi:hypothetical protein
MHFTHELCKMGTILSLVMNITEALSPFYLTKHRRPVTLPHSLRVCERVHTYVANISHFHGKNGGPMNHARFTASKGDFCSLPSVQDRSWRPTSLLFSEFRGLLLSVKWPGREPDDLLPPGAVPPLPHMPSWRAQRRIYLGKELRKDELHILYSSLHAY